MEYLKLSIVFLNFNRINETILTSNLLKSLLKDRSDFEIIAVDNASTDGTTEFLLSQTQIKTLLSPKNIGIAAYNIGLEATKGKFILVLDDDSCPQDIEVIIKALEFAEAHPKVGIIAAKIISNDSTPQWSWHLPFPTSAQTLAPSPFFIGCGFLIRRDLFKQIGWYPGDFFLYQNEIDVSFKVRLAGYEILYDPNFVVVHRGQPNQRPGWRRVFYPTRNTLWLIRQYYPTPLSYYMLTSRLLIGLIRACSFGQLSCYSKAVYEGLTRPVTKTILPPALRQTFQPFFKQNSFFHQLFRLT